MNPQLALWAGMITAPMSLILIASYGLWRAPQAPELELMLINLIFLIVILFPRLRSRLLRRRAWVGAWMRDDHWLTSLLRGGAIYMGFQLLITIPASLLLLVELQHITLEVWSGLIIFSAICALLRVALSHRLSKILRPQAKSVIAREWVTILFLVGAALILLRHTLYTPRPNFEALSLREALEYTVKTLPTYREGMLSDIIWLSALKETLFWWSILHAPTLLIDFPPMLTWVSQLLLVLAYALYHLSVLFALSQVVAGSLELVDPYFYSFLRGDPPHNED